jgi:hypothetical protein
VPTFSPDAVGGRLDLDWRWQPPARYETMNRLLGFLTENCCQGVHAAPVAAENKRAKSARKKERVP